MAVFTYKALRLTGGSSVTGIIVADTARQARDELRDRGMMLQSVCEQRRSPGLSRWVQYVADRKHRAMLVDFVRELSTLVGVGVPILEALDTIAMQQAGGDSRRARTRHGFHGVILSLSDRVSSGSSLAQAMRDRPTVFDPMAIHLVEIGEQAGTLDKTLEQLASYRERSQQMRGRIASALLYPAIVLVTGIAVGIFLMTYVVPNLLEPLLEAGRRLPWPTRVVRMFSDLLVQRWWLLTVIAGIVTSVVTVTLATTQGRRLWHRLQLRLPLVGSMIRKQAVVRTAVTIATMIRSGIEFIPAIQVAAESLNNRVLREALHQCGRAVHAGAEISEALDHTGVFPPTVIRVFAVGQQTGRLDDMLDQLAVNYDRQVTTMAGRLTAVLEPVLILMLALMVGFIAFATILPIMEAGHVLQ